MLDNIRAQLEIKDSFTKSGFYNHQMSPEASSFSNDLYPFLMEYHHELNPAFLYNITNPEMIDVFPAVTVRDGAMLLAHFVLKFFQQIPQMKTHFFIHKDLAYLVPSNLRAHFSAWNIVQTNQIRVQDAKKLLITGIITDVTTDLDQVSKKLKSLGPVSPLTQVEVYLPQRPNPFGMPWTESNLTQKVTEILKEHFPEHKIHYLKTRELMDPTSLTSTYCLDLLSDSLLVSDNFLNHFVVARGGATSGMSSTSEKNPIYEIDLSFHHKIQYIPLPEVTSYFPEMIFYKKQSQARDLLADPSFHALFKKKNL